MCKFGQKVPSLNPLVVPTMLQHARNYLSKLNPDTNGSDNPDVKRPYDTLRLTMMVSHESIIEGRGSGHTKSFCIGLRVKSH